MPEFDSRRGRKIDTRPDLVQARLWQLTRLLAEIQKYHTDRLQRLQNTAARIVARIRKFDHITPILKKLHWLPVEYRIKFKVLLLVYKCLNHLAPKYLIQLISVYTSPKDTRSTGNLSLDPPMSRTVKYGDRAFAVAGPALWAKLPISIRKAASVDSFKTSLKRHFFKELK